jgi:ABC-2 type transport system permease protein
MRKIFKIAKLELNILFYSPVAWLVLAIFMIQCGLSFLDNMQSTRTGISLGYYPGPITRTLFGGNSGLFTVMQGYIYLYLPILTMGLMSRETSSGSIKLLLSSPVKLRQIILGKYFAIIGYGLALIGILFIYVIIGACFIDNVDLGFIFSGLFGLYLLICTYAAIGLFMSCLTTYQVVAAISTLAVFAVLRYVGTLWQEIDFVRDLTYFLSISGRTEKMVAGLITTKDVFYYLIIIASFLSLCVLRLKTERELKPMSVKVGRYVLLACTALLLGYVTSRPILTGYLDTTAAKSLTITKTSQKITQQIDGELKVTTYVNMLAPNLWYVLPASRNNDLGRLEQFKRFIPGMDVNYVYYYKKPIDTNYQDYKWNPNLKGITNVDKIAEQMSTNMGVDGSLFMPPAQINKLINLEPEGNMLVRTMEYKGKSTFLRFYMGDNDPYASEAEVDAALKRLLTKAPKVAFITGNNERGTDFRGDREYQLISSLKTRRTALINQGFDVDTVDLRKQDIGADVGVVVLGDPTETFTPAEQQKLAAYINKGGNMLITGEPGRQHILNPILSTLGVQLKSGILVKPDRNFTPGFINAKFAPQSLGLDSNIDRVQKAGATVAMQGAAAIDYPASGSFNVKPLLLSTAGGWNKQVGANGAAETHAPKQPVLITANRPVKMPQGVTMMQVTAGKPSANLTPVDAARLKAMKQKLKQKPAATTTVVSSPVAASSGGGGGMVAVASVGGYFPPPVKSPPVPGTIDLTTANLDFNAAAGDEKGVFPITVSMTRNINGKEQRIIVSGDADFISNGELSRTKRGENLYYMFGLFRWLNNGSFPVDVTRPPARDIDIKISRAQITGLMWVCKAAIPALIAILGAITLFKRRRN